MILPGPIRAAIIDHCLGSLPDEACGLYAVADDRVMRIYPGRNLESARDAFTLDPEDHLRAITDARSEGWEIGGAFHSHPGGRATMSDRDVTAALEPDWVYLVVGMKRAGEIRGWTVRDRQVIEVELDD